MAKKNGNNHLALPKENTINPILAKIEAGESITEEEQSILATTVITGKIISNKLEALLDRATKATKKHIQSLVDPVMLCLFPDMRLHNTTHERTVMDNTIDLDLVKAKITKMTKQEILDNFVDPARIPIATLRKVFGDEVMKEVSHQVLEERLNTEYYDSGDKKWKRFATNTQFWKEKEKLLSW